jgi:type I restriction enzyme S subunit
MNKIAFTNFRRFKDFITLEKQNLIGDKLIDILEKNDLLSNKIKDQIQNLQTYRLSLISYAVTGKIDVRDWQHPQK